MFYNAESIFFLNLDAGFQTLVEKEAKFYARKLQLQMFYWVCTGAILIKA